MTTALSILLGLSVLAGLANILTLLLRSQNLTHRILHDSDPEAPTSGDLVSVIIPARNEEGNVADCLASLQAQTYEELEIIAVDDRSEDRTREILDELAATEPRPDQHRVPPRIGGQGGRR